MKMKDVMQTANVLIKYNDWRTKESTKMVKPGKVTKHLDTAIIMLVRYAEVLEQREAKPTLTFENSVVVPKEDKEPELVKSMSASNEIHYRVGDIVNDEDGHLYLVTDIDFKSEFPVETLKLYPSPIMIKYESLSKNKRYNTKP
jgi:hypothetical protein